MPGQGAGENTVSPAALFSRLGRDKKLLVPVFWTFLTRGMAAFGTLALSLVIARYAGAHELGLFMIALSLIVGLGILARFGMDNAMLRFGGIAVSRQDLPRFRGLRRQAIFISMSISVLFSAGMIFFADNLAALFSNKDLAALMLPMALVLPIHSLIYMQGTWLKALKRPAYAPLFETGAVAFLTALLVVINGLLGYPVSAVRVAYFLLAATAVVLLMGQLVLAMVQKNVFPDASQGISIQSGLSRILPDFVLMAMTAYAVQSGALLILGMYAPTDQVGIYSTAHKMAFIVNFILMVFNSILAPRFASLYADGNHKELAILVRRSTKYMTLFCLPVSLILFAFAGFWLSFFGKEFEQAEAILRILIVAQFINVATGAVGFLLNMTGHHKEMRNLVLMTGFITIGLSFALIPVYGIWGAVASNATALILQNLLAARLVSKLLNIRTIPGWEYLAKLPSKKITKS